MNSENFSEEQGHIAPQFVLQGSEAVCTGDGFTLTARNWSEDKESGLSAILSFHNGAADPIKDRVKFGLASSRQKFTAKIPESYQANFEPILFALENFLRTEDAKGRIKTDTREIEWECGLYRIVDDAICWVKRTDAGDVNVPLCNFSAQIVSEEIHDDGAEESRVFLVDGKLASGKPLAPARVPAASFGSMNWVLAQFGIDAVISAGQASKDRLREALQLRSENATRKRIFKHSGWRQIDGRWAFLTAGGALGSKDPVNVDLGPELVRYQLPLVPEDPIGAMRVSLQLLKVAPLSVTAPLWAGVFRAPLASIYPLDLSLWLEGPTGSLKSTLAALFLSHFGEFNRTDLPGTWSSTVNQLESRAFLLKDIPFVVDDYAPGTFDGKELEIKASRVLRSQGNLSGRGRLRSDLSERPARPPRGLIISTGEQHPPGQSILARTVLIEARRDGIDFNTLAVAQRETARLSHAMAGYIAWLIPQMGNMPALLKKMFLDTRESITADYSHARIPEALSHLWLGLGCALRYAEEKEACTSIEAQELRHECWEALLEIGRRQGQIVEEKRPTRRFAQVLFSLLTQGRIALLPKAEPARRTEEGEFLGWYDSDWLYLLPEPAFKAVSQFCRDAGEPFAIREDRLKRDLKEEGILKTHTDRWTATVRIGSGVKRVLQLDTTLLERLLQLDEVEGGEKFPRQS